MTTPLRLPTRAARIVALAALLPAVGAGRPDARAAANAPIAEAVAGPWTGAAPPSRQPSSPSSPTESAQNAPPPLPSDAASTVFGQLPLSFVPNAGQADPWATHVVRGRATSVLFGAGGVAYRLARPAADAATRCGPKPERGLCRAEWAAPPAPDPLAALAAGGRAGDTAAGTVDDVRLDFVGGRAARPEAAAPTGTRVNIFHGPRERWIRGLPAYARLEYHDVWPGIDVRFDGAVDAVKHTFVVRPGADPSAIRLAWRGARALRVDAAGRLVVDTAAGPLVDEAPVAWQDVGGRRVAVDVRYRLAVDPVARGDGVDGTDDADRVAVTDDGAGAPLAYGFAVGDHDPTRPLVLDPAVVVFAGYIGGTGFDRGLGLAIDGERNVYVTGTMSQDAFVAKVAADGRKLDYLTVFGGDAHDGGFDVDVDPTGAAYVTGPTKSLPDTFPLERGPDLTYGGGVADGYVAKLAPGTGDLVYLGYIGGAGEDFGEGIAVDDAGHAYLTGLAESSEATFPVKVGPDVTQNGQWDAYVVKVQREPFAPNPVDNFVWSGFVGGARDDVAVTQYYLSSGHIGIDDAGNAYLSGQTTSDERTFPDGDGFGDLPGPDRTYNGSWDAYVAKIRADGTGLAYAGYVGGDDWDEGKGMAIDAAGAAYLTGDTYSGQATFPVMVGPDLTFNGMGDAFLAKVAPDGSSLEYCGYIGGDDDESGQVVRLGPDGAVYVAGNTESGENTFPATNGPDLTFNGPEGLADDQAEHDAFVGRLKSPVAAADPRDNWDYLGYVGGSAPDHGFWLDVDADGNAYLAGETKSGPDTFPNGRGMAGVPGPGARPNGDQDAYVAKIAWRPLTNRIAFLPWAARSVPLGDAGAPVPIVPTASNTARTHPTPTITPPPTPTRRPTKPVPVPPGEEVVFFDDFSDPNVGWTVDGQPGAAMSYVDEQLVVASDDPSEIAAVFAPVRFTDGAIDVTMQRTEDVESVIGILFGPKTGSYWLYVLDTGVYAFFRTETDHIRLITPQRSSPALLPSTAPLHLRIERDGGHVELFANGQQLVAVDDPYVAERGTVAFLVESGSDAAAAARIDDVLVTRFTGDRPTATAVPTAAPTVPPTAAPTQEAGTQIFADDFGDPTTGWLVTDTADMRARYVNGEYEIAMHTPGLFASAYAPNVACADCTIDVTVRFASAIFGGAGIYLGENGRSPAVSCAVISDGRYVIERYTGSNWETIVAPTASSAVKTGGGAVNKLKAIRQEGRLRFYANGMLLHAVDVPGLAASGGAGVVAVVGPQAEFVARYDDFRMRAGSVTQPADGPSPLPFVALRDLLPPRDAGRMRAR